MRTRRRKEAKGFVDQIFEMQSIGVGLGARWLKGVKEFGCARNFPRLYNDYH
jgi:hypothetical protein